MAKFKCFSAWKWKKKKYKENIKPTNPADESNNNRITMQINLQQPAKPFHSDKLISTAFGVSVPFDIVTDSTVDVKVTSHENPIGESMERAYEGEQNLTKRNFCESYCDDPGNMNSEISYSYRDSEKSAQSEADIIQNGHISDPGVEKTVIWGSLKLFRSCSNLESIDIIRNIVDQSPPSKSRSFEQLQELTQRVRKNVNPGSPGSVMTHHTAYRVMLKECSSSRILPSRSRRLRWKLFLWSRRNLQRPQTIERQPPSTVAALNRQEDYCLDTLEPNRAMGLSKTESSGSFTEESLIKFHKTERGKDCCDGLHNQVSGLRPHNQRLAFSMESSSLLRVDEWVKDLQTKTKISINEDNDEEDIILPNSHLKGKSPERTTTHLSRRQDTALTEEILHLSGVIQSLNSSSTVAHISAIGLNVVPIISQFSSLRSVNLSGNFLVHITPGSLPKRLHTLNLSRNNIKAIEGLQELTRLRVLDLSYNRISRIGHGLSNCATIKELYLAGNKISDLGGLHRLLKLAVLDLSFNRVTTTKALGKLLTNYNSLLALNLLGNPIQNNVSDEQLCKAVSGLLPKLVYLNKQPIKPQRAREALANGVVKAALGDNGWNSRRKTSKKVIKPRSLGSTTPKERNKSKDNGLRLKTTTSVIASTSY